MKYLTRASELSTVSDEVLITIKPMHAHRLYDGTKTYELRKTVPSSVPRKFYLYEVDGISAITGHVIVEKVCSGTPESLWAALGRKATTKERFFRYFAGRDVAHALEVNDVLRYRQPIGLKCILEVQPSFRVPQNFLYLQNLPALKGVLRDRSFAECIDSNHEGIQLRGIQQVNEPIFVELVEKHISGSYLETGGNYAEHLLSIKGLGEDAEGILTLRKHLLEILYENRLAGFVVLTEKLGGSVKTGPTILMEEFRSAGVGKELRRTLHAALRRNGFRKVYCTAPLKNMPAVAYLSAAGYRIEAHLRRHYHTGHDELVFGYLLSKYRGPELEFIRPITPVAKFQRIDRKTQEVLSFLQEEMSGLYCQLPEDWAIRQVREAIAAAKGRSRGKKKRVIFAGFSTRPEVVALCVLKRGGSAKVIVLTKTSHRSSLIDFILYVEKSLKAARSYDVRKIYSHVPLTDTVTTESFLESGFSIEGVLERPYNDFSEMLVLAKLTRQA